MRARLGHPRGASRDLGRHADAEKAQARFGDDRRCHGEGADDQRSLDQVGKNMARDDLAVTGAKASRGDDEIARSERQGLPANDAAIGNPALGNQRQDEVEQTLAKKGHDRDAEQERWKGPDNFNKFLNYKVDLAAEVTGDRAEGDANKTRDEDDSESNQQR